jgi:hypothetical protein
MASVAAASPITFPDRRPGWIYKPSWDLPLLIFSAVLVPMPFVVAWLAQVSGWMNQHHGGGVNRGTAPVLDHHVHVSG